MATRTPPRISLTAYKDYLRAIRYCIAHRYGHLPHQLAAVAEAVEQQPGYLRIKHKRVARWERVAQLLNTAWQTEVALNLPRFSSDEGVRALSIHWGTIQLYYAVYCSASAWLEAVHGNTAPQKHRATLNTLASCAARHHVFPVPWSAVCVCHKPQSFSGIDGHQPKPIRTVRSPSYNDYLDYICTALKAVRDRDLKDKALRWKKDNGLDEARPLPRGRRALLDGDLCATSLFDFLWHLRVRAQYGDAEFLMLGREHAAQATDFYECLWRVASATLLVFEKLTVAVAGREPMLVLVADLLRRSETAAETVGVRVAHW